MREAGIGRGLAISARWMAAADLKIAAWKDLWPE